MIVTIHQPEYLPWLGFFDRIAKADLFVVLDQVQFQRGFINRNKIKTPTGWQWLTVPIIHEFHRKSINQVEIDNQITDWKRSHWAGLVHNYSKAPYFGEYSDFFKDVFERDWKLLAELDIYLIKNLMNLLGLKTSLKKSSSLNVGGKSTELLINICKEVGADTYLSGEGGKRYMDMKRFEEEGIKVLFQEFNHPKYPQAFEKEAGFIPNLSIVDLLFNCGQKSLNIIKGESL